jgi:hypothetical protein
MRSEVVFQASRKVNGRYQLCRVCARGTRELHITSRRVEDTINAVLTILGAIDPPHSFAMPPLSDRERLHLRIS